MTCRSLLPYATLGVGAAASLLAGPALHGLWPGWRWHHQPLHSTMEALGGLASLAMASVLFHRWKQERRGEFQALGSGLLGMGLLTIFHAIAEPGNGFVLLRNVASLAGGVGFALVWRSAPEAAAPRRAWIPWLITGCAVGFGTWVLLAPAQVPEMIRNGQFTPTAVAPQSLASLLFLAAAWRLLAAYTRTGRSEAYLFAGLALLFALAELVFMYSVPWDARWWFWHTFCLTACLLMLGYLGLGYLRMVADLQTALDERQRMAEDLHDGAIQSIFAITLSLERCRRQVAGASEETAGRLGTAVKELKAVIRDLRGYLVGAETPIGNGRRLEAALASLAQSMDDLRQARFQLDVSPAAADQVTSEQAGHLVAIAREAMSNSIRHSSAQTVRVSLGLHEGHVRLVIADDGSGFHPASRHPGGHGLTNMTARARKMGGRLDVLAEPGRGTRVVCDLPKEPVHAPL